MSYRRKHIQPKIRKLKPRRKLSGRALLLIFLCAVFCILAIVGVVFFLQKFQVKGVLVSGNEAVSSQDIQTLAWNTVNKKILGTELFGIFTKNIFTANTAAIAQTIQNTFPKIGSAEIKKEMPGTLAIQVQERQPFMQFCGTDDLSQCFVIDQTGIVFETAANGPAGLTVVRNIPATQADMGKNAIPMGTAQMLAKVQASLKDNFQVGISHVNVSNILSFRTSEGWEIDFDPAENMDTEVAKMESLLRDQISVARRKNLQYIYLQYKDRAYYK